MNRPIQSAVRYVSVLAVCLFALLGTPAIVQAADYTDTDIDQFDIVSSSSRRSQWTTRGCTDDDDVDEGCYVEVRADSSLQDDISARTATSTSTTNKWTDYFNSVLLNDCSLRNRDDYHEKNKDFNDCWEDKGATVTWPQVDPSEYFEATGFCKSGDRSCSININICYNANECDGASRNDDEFDEDDGRMADFFDETRRCLYDVSNRRFTKCINDQLREVYNTLQRRGRMSYSALNDQLKEDGVEIERYSSSLSKVENTSYFGTEYLGARNRLPVVSPAPARAGFVSSYPSGQVTTSKPWINRVFWPTIDGYAPIPGGDFILVNFTQYLEAQPYARICGTSAGCIETVGRSSHFSYMSNVSIVNSDRNTIACLRNRGYYIGRGTVLAFNDPNLQTCDRRMSAANTYCPNGGEGAKAELLKMYNLGLATNLLNQATAQSLQNDLARASTTAPRCLCTAGFASGDLVVSTSTTDNPWSTGTLANYSNLCG